MSLTAVVKVSIEADQKSPLDLADVRFQPLIQAVRNLENGTGLNQVNQLFTDQRTLTASASEELDLSGGLNDAFGNSIAFTKVKGVLVIAASGNTNDVNITRPASSGVPIFLNASDGMPVKPNGFFMWTAPDAGGVTVTNSSADRIALANSAGGSAVTYNIAIIGSE